MGLCTRDRICGSCCKVGGRRVGIHLQILVNRRYCGRFGGRFYLREKGYRISGSPYLASMTCSVLCPALNHQFISTMLILLCIKLIRKPPSPALPPWMTLTIQKPLTNPLHFLWRHLCIRKQTLNHTIQRPLPARIHPHSLKRLA